MTSLRFVIPLLEFMLEHDPRFRGAGLLRKPVPTLWSSPGAGPGSSPIGANIRIVSVHGTKSAACCRYSDGLEKGLDRMDDKILDWTTASRAASPPRSGLPRSGQTLDAVVQSKQERPCDPGLTIDHWITTGPYVSANGIKSGGRLFRDHALEPHRFLAAFLGRFLPADQ